jgi:hypothetical protein
MPAEMFSEKEKTPRASASGEAEKPSGLSIGENSLLL